MKSIKIDDLASEIVSGMQEYASYAADEVKEAVKKAGASVKKDIAKDAPRKSGKYAKSWTVKNTKETATSLEVTVYSKTRYQLAHLLEKGHAKRNGGRVSAIPHIKPAEERAISKMQEELERSLGG